MSVAKDENVLVSICCLAFNHESYIRQCLDGFIMQKTSFAFEILIHDDASTDRTAVIIKEYQEWYPDIIKPIYQSVNQYSRGVKVSSVHQFSRVSGKYIAMCEGDDYWIDPYKLQKQVDFMEANLDYSLIYHKVYVYNEKLRYILDESNNISSTEEDYTLIDLAKNNFIHTPSVLFRKDCLDFDFIMNSRNTLIDYSIWMLCAENGKIKYLPEQMAVYRVWEGSVWELRPQSTKSVSWIKILLPLLNRFSSLPDVYYLLFNQLLHSYQEVAIFEQSKNKISVEFDALTKRMLTEVNGFQRWWFLYMIHLKKSRAYRLRYFYYLFRNRSLDSIMLIKKCLY